MALMDWLGWDLEGRNLLSDTAISPPFIYLIGCPAMAAMVLGCYRGHEWTRAHWPWLLNTRGQVIAFAALLAVFVGYAALGRRARTEYAKALHHGDRARFRNSTPRPRWINWGIGGVMGVTYGWMGVPFGLWILLFMPFAFIAGSETWAALREATRHGLDAREAVLRAKLAPHFIFNTLNTLHAQIERDPRGAQATTERLAELFRQVVEVADRPTIPLKRELAFVEAYLGIEQARLGDRLRVSVQVPEELESAQVPPLSLQVLVENAVKHGVAPLEQGGELRVGAERQGGELNLWVEDPGSGASPRKGTGTALDTLRQRLDRPEDFSMGMVEGRHRVGFRWRLA